MKVLFSFLLAAFLVAGCSNPASSTSNDSGIKDMGSGSSSGTAQDLPDAFKNFSGNVSLSVQGEYVVITATDVPDHKSPYFDVNDSNYEAYNGDNPDFQLNPNRIVEQNLVFKIPINPQEASSHSYTQLGPIGVAINGVALFNQYAGPNRALGDEINSFDQYNGHPQQSGMYHYHVEPLHITTEEGEDGLIGFLLDGFPVYGPYENGKLVTNDDLDQYHGHFGPTKEYPNGIYHYHITSDSPYINGGQYYGTPGIVTQ